MIFLIVGFVTNINDSREKKPDKQNDILKFYKNNIWKINGGITKQKQRYSFLHFCEHVNAS